MLAASAAKKASSAASLVKLRRPSPREWQSTPSSLGKPSLPCCRIPGNATFPPCCLKESASRKLRRERGWARTRLFAARPRIELSMTTPKNELGCLAKEFRAALEARLAGDLTGEYRLP